MMRAQEASTIRQRALRLVLILVVISGSVWGKSRAQEKARPLLAPDLAVVPHDAFFLAVARPADLLSGEFGKSLREIDTRRFAVTYLLEEAARVATAGTPLTRVERVVLWASRSVPGVGILWAVTAKASLDRAAVLRHYENEEPETRLRGLRYHRSAETASVLFLDDRTFLVGPATGVEKCLAQEPAWRDNSLMAEALMIAAGSAQLVVAVRTAGLMPKAQELAPAAGLEGLRPLLDAQSCCVALQFGEELLAHAHLSFAQEGAARQGARALTVGRDLALEHLSELGEVLGDRMGMLGGRRRDREVLQFFEGAAPGVKGLRIEQEGKSVRVGLQVPGRGAEWGLLMLSMPVTSPVTYTQRTAPVQRPQSSPAEGRPQREQ